MGFRTCSFLSPSSSYAIPLIPTSSRTSIPARLNPVASAISFSFCPTEVTCLSVSIALVPALQLNPRKHHKLLSLLKVYTLVGVGLPLSMTEGRFKEAFSPFGKPMFFGSFDAVKIVLNKNTKQSHGFAYIWYSSEESAELAVKEMDGKFLDGRFILVAIARHGSCKTPRKATPYKF